MAKRFRKGKPAPKTPFEQLRELAPEWTENILSTKDDDMKNMMVKLELENKLIAEQKKLDPDLPAYREQLKTANETYALPTKTNKLKMRVIATILEERGKA